jgi:Tol biopolymer transport system component
MALQIAWASRWIVVAAAASPIRAQSVERISCDGSGVPGNGDSSDPSTSDAGNRVAFSSLAINLVAGDTNFLSDVFVRDRVAGTTTRVSVSTAGVQANGPSYAPRITADGNFAVFASDAGNLIALDTNSATDVLMHDIAGGTTFRASLTDANDQPDGASYDPAVSSDGRFVAFTSLAGNIVSGDGNFASDVFLRDRQNQTTIRVSVSSQGGEASGFSFKPAISRDGRYVAFASAASNLDPLDLDGYYDVFVRDTVAGTTTLVSLGSGGVKGDSNSVDPAISDDGRCVAFTSAADNLVPGDLDGDSDVFVRDVVNGTTICASVDSDGNISNTFGPVASGFPAISADGQSVFFASGSDVLVDDDQNLSSDVFCRFAPLGMTTRQSIAPDFSEADRGAAWSRPACSADASFVAFVSNSTNLVSGATTTRHVYQRQRPAPSSASWQSFGSGYPGTNGTPSLTAGAAPQLNRSLDLSIGNSLGSWTDALVLIGMQQVDWPTAWGGHLLVDPAVSVLVALDPGGGTFSGRVPPDDALVGVTFYGQALEIDPGASRSVSFTPGIELVLGY